MSDRPAERTAEKKAAQASSPPIETLTDVLKSLNGKVVTMVNPESLEDAPMGYQITTGFYRAKILGVTDHLVTVATELVKRGREGAKEPVKQFIPIARIKRVSFAKSDVLVHV